MTEDRASLSLVGSRLLLPGRYTALVAAHIAEQKYLDHVPKGQASLQPALPVSL